MQLSKIKIAGFKSFVDPTTVVLTSNLIGVVGPNGCGKSNIVDAILWVMGESSAKQLRGDTLKDVIFSGSSSRSPVSQAAVELLFDNSDRRAGGQYASYNEISIKRQIDLDSVSTYYLNGSRCRKRDIQDIFLGTGLGPRNYAIIEQNTISRLIDAKPEELRSFIEEVAGISKYKERRRETENRIQHTNDNLSRLTDIRDELAQQLKHLHRQAKVAKKYQELKEDERQLTAERFAMDWRTLETYTNNDQQTLMSQENLVEAEIAGLRKVEREMGIHREKRLVEKEVLDSAQSSFYSTGNEVSKYEQNIQYTNDLILSIQQDIQRTTQQDSDIKEHLKQDRAVLEEATTNVDLLEPKLKIVQEDRDSSYEALKNTEQTMQDWQTKWDSFNALLADYLMQQEVAETRFGYLQKNIESYQQRIKALQTDLNEIDLTVMQQDIDDHCTHIMEIENQKSDITDELNTKRNALLKLTDILTDLNKQISEKNGEKQQLYGHLSSLDALQHAAFGKDCDEMENWLETVGLADTPRLAQTLVVAPDWLDIVEFVAENNLQDIVVDVDDSYITKLSALEKGNLGIVSVNSDSAVEEKADLQLRRLSEKINIDLPLFRHIYIAEDIGVAINIRQQLKIHESVITPDGIWLGRHWCRVCKGMDEEKRTLSREKKINQIKQDCALIEKQLGKLGKNITANQLIYDQLEQQSNDLNTLVQQKQEALSQYKITLVEKQTQQKQEQSRVTMLNNEITALKKQIKDHKDEIEVVQKKDSAMADQDHVTKQQKNELMMRQEEHQVALVKARELWKKMQDTAYNVALELSSSKSTQTALKQAMERNQMQLSQLQTHVQELEQSLLKQQEILTSNDAVLALKLKDKISKEKLLTEAKVSVEKIDHALQECEHSRYLKNQKLTELREHLEKIRLATQEGHIRLKNIEEQIQTSGYELTPLLEQLAEDANTKIWEERLAAIALKIEKLSPINLAAIDESVKLSERKRYLDAQHEDLTSALDTLANAVQKIDKETRSRFKETFDQLNINLQEKFPQLFGGGHVNLELTSKNFLDAGVTITAQPPGKRNTSIQLLSGGEKALTAVALVFAIFDLNPAPFCVLDEVDAPLDDVNVARFSNMMVSMSANVQCLFITHNKITMEIANQLLGVTMQEEGISRLVSVDLDKAVKMAKTA